MSKLTYSEKLHDPRWQKMRLKTFERDHWQCQHCMAEHKPLHAHHKIYRAGAEGPWDCAMGDLITLCGDCHTAEHARLDRLQKRLLSATRRFFDEYDDILELWIGLFEQSRPVRDHDCFLFMLAMGEVFASRDRAAGDTSAWARVMEIGEAEHQKAIAANAGGSRG